MIRSATITIPRSQVSDIIEILDRTEELPRENDTIYCFTARFNDGCEVDIKVCNGDSPYIDPVLFDARGYELAVGDPCWDILGEYWFMVGDDEYVVNISTV